MRYRKKPVIIEAFQWTEKIWHSFLEGQLLDKDCDKNDYPSWFLKALTLPKETKGAAFLKQFPDDPDGESFYLVINTLEGWHMVRKEDFIIQGIKGELYSCKPDIFEQTYEKVDERLRRNNLLYFYRKKLYNVEAFCPNLHPLPDWFFKALKNEVVNYDVEDHATYFCKIKRLIGLPILVNREDYICLMNGDINNLYAVKKKEFEKDYTKI